MPILPRMFRPHSAAGFEDGWTSAETNLDVSGTGDSPALYFRVKRRWLAP